MNFVIENDFLNLNEQNIHRRFIIFQQSVSHLNNELLFFRCDIPVIIMGETGCGKTRLIQFMCQLQCPDVKNVQNMFVMKVY